ncbi:MAG: hypothetical protein M0R41_06880 [Methylobacter tundripaludum]|jgi:hypothetical protein|nr:hypothetical protein [Methylobacter tundripaludum]
MNANTLIDPSKLSEQQLEDLLQAKRNKTEQDRQAYKELVGSTVPPAVKRLMDISMMLVEAKAQTFGYFKNILEMKESVYSTDKKSRNNPQQSHTFSADRYSITIGYRVNDGWDDTVSEGVHKVYTFIESLAKDEDSSRLTQAIFKLLKKDKKGDLKASRVLELKQLSEKFHNADFNDGVKTILDAYKPVRTCWFIEAFYINDNQEKVAIPLSMSAVDFPEGFEFDFLTAKTAKEEA